MGWAKSEWDGKTSAMAKELDAVHEDSEERETQMGQLTKALSEAGLGLR